MERLFGHLQEHGCEILEAVELALAEAVVQDEMQQLKEQEQQLNAEVAKLKQAQRHLQEAEEETEKLETQYKAAQQKEQEIHVALEGNRAVLKQLQREQSYTSREAAQAELDLAKKEKEQQNVHMKKLPRRRSGREKHGMKHRHCRSVTGKTFRSKRNALQCRQKYEARMAAFGLTTEQWQAVTQQYTREEADLFQEKLDAHKAQQAQAQGRYTSAKEQIGAQGKPDLEVLQQNLQEAEQVWKAGRKSGSSGAPMPCQQ